METELHKQPIFEEDAFCSLQATQRTLKHRALCAEKRQPRNLMRFSERHLTPPPSDWFGLVPRTSGHPIAFFLKSNRYVFAAHCRLPTDELQLLAPGSQRGISMRRGSAARPSARTALCWLCGRARRPCTGTLPLHFETGERARVGGKGLVLLWGWLRVWGSWFWGGTAASPWV